MRVNSGNRPAKSGLNRTLRAFAGIQAFAILNITWIIFEIIGKAVLARFGSYSLNTVDPALFLCMFYVLFNVSNVKYMPYGWMNLVYVYMFITLMNIVLGLSNASYRADTFVASRFFLPSILIPMIAVINAKDASFFRACRAISIYVGLALSALVFVRLAFGGTLFMSLDELSFEATGEARGLTAEGALLILQAYWLNAYRVNGHRFFRNGKMFIAAQALLLLAILGSRQGTVILAMIAGNLFYLMFFRRKFAGFALALLPLLIFAAYTGVQNLSALGNFGEYFNNRSSDLNTRQSIWLAFSSDYTKYSLFHELFGMPFGSYPPLYIYFSGKVIIWKNVLHSQYFGGLRIFGAIGFVSFFIVHIAMFFRLINKYYTDNNLNDMFICCLIITMMLYYYSYEANMSSVIVWYYCLYHVLLGAANTRKRQVVTRIARGGPRRHAPVAG